VPSPVDGGAAGIGLSSHAAWRGVKETSMTADSTTATMDPAAAMAWRTAGTALFLDVRKRPAYDESGRRIEGATWRDPFAVDAWVDALPRDRPVVVYCVHGHEVSHGVRDALIERGIDARLIAGGYEAWVEAGGATEPNPAD
jgi:Fe-Mn family superoxide dismutase